MPQPLLNVIISNPHYESDVKLLPPKVVCPDGHSISFNKNPWMAWLWARWGQSIQIAKTHIGKSPFILTLTGDLIEGIHHRSDEIVAAKLVEHLAIAREALGELISMAHTVYVIKGTECHTNNLETVFAKDIGAGEAHDFIQYKLGGVLVDARHHMPTTGRLHLEASALSIVMANNRSNAVRAGHTPARIFLRGHRHLAGHYSDGEAMILCTGAWQGLTRHGRKVVPDAVPRPSMAILDARSTPKGHLPTLTHLVFNPPQSLCAHVVQN